MPEIPEDNDAWLRVEFKAIAASTAVSHPSDAQLVSAFGSTLAGEYGAVTGATNATPVVVTAVGHGLADGDPVIQYGIQGNEAANGAFVVRNPTADTYELESLDGSPVAGSGDYLAGTAERWHKGVPDHAGVALDYVAGSAGRYAALVPGNAPFRGGDRFAWIVYDVGPYAGKVFEIGTVTVKRRGRVTGVS